MAALLSVVKQTGVQSNTPGHMIQMLAEKSASENILNPNVSQAVVSMESGSSVSDHDVEMVRESLTSLRDAFREVAEEINMESLLDPEHAHAVDAGLMAALAASDLGHGIKSGNDVMIPSGSKNVVAMGIPSMEDAYTDRADVSLEAFDETANTLTSYYSFEYNVKAVLQDAVGELFYPTIIESNDTSGFSITAEILRVMKSATHKTTGALTDFNFVNANSAYKDGSIIRADFHKLVPVYRGGVGDKPSFINAGELNATYLSGVTEAFTADSFGSTTSTLPLAVGKEINILGLSQTDELLSSSAMDESDSIDPAIQTENIYVGIVNGAGDAWDTVKIGTKGLAGAAWTYTLDGNFREVQNMFDVNVTVAASTIALDDSPINAAEPAIPAGHTLTLRVEGTGKGNVQTGTFSFYANRISLVSVTDAAGLAVASDASVYTDAMATVEKLSLIGIDLYAFRKQCNQRQNNQLIDITEFSQVFPVPFRSAISVDHCRNGASNGDPKDLKALLKMTKLATSGAAVRSLMDYRDRLRAYGGLIESDENMIRQWGIGAALVYKPVFIEPSAPVNVSTELNSLSTSDRPEEISSYLVGLIRDHAQTMLTESGLEASLDANDSGKLAIIVATDGNIGRYITNDMIASINGSETSTMPIKVATSLNNELRGRMIISFGLFNADRNKRPNPLNFGHMAWVPEVTVVLPVTVGGSTRSRLTVTPRFLHAATLPLMTHIEVTGLPEAIGKIS